MFWLLGTGKKFPGRKEDCFAVATLALALLVLVVFALAPTAEARPRFRDKAGAMRLRLSGSLGLVQYESFSSASNARTRFDSLPHLGRRAEAERFLTVRRDAWPALGLWGDLDNFPVRLFGKDIHYSAFSAGVVWRPAYTFTTNRDIAARRNWNVSDFFVNAGLSVQYFPDVRAFVGKRDFDNIKPKLLGAKVQLHWNINLTRKRLWRLDLGAHYIHPIKVSGVGSVKLDTTETRSYGGAIHLERVLRPGVDIGGGFLYQGNTLIYTPIESTKPQKIIWNNFAPHLSIQFWLGSDGKGLVALPF